MVHLTSGRKMPEAVPKPPPDQDPSCGTRHPPAAYSRRRRLYLGEIAYGPTLSRIKPVASMTQGRRPSLRWGAVLDPELLGEAGARIVAVSAPPLLLDPAQFDAADLAGNRLRQFRELEAAHPFEGRQMLAHMGEDR